MVGAAGHTNTDPLQHTRQEEERMAAEVRRLIKTNTDRYLELKRAGGTASQ